MSKFDSRSPVVVSALAVALGGAAFPAQAATYEVTNLGSGADSLRAAIQQANAKPGTDIITFSSQLSGTIPVGGSNALPYITDNLVIQGNGNITLDAQGDFAALVSGKYAEGSMPENGYGEIGGSPFEYLTNTNLSVSGLTVTGAEQAGIFAFGKYSGGLSVSDSVITGNGGAILAFSPKYMSTEIVDSTISNNGDGKYSTVGHISFLGGLTISGSTISGNTGPGAAVYFEGFDFGPGSPAASLTIADSAINNNTAGGVRAKYTESAEITGSVIAGNTVGYGESGGPPIGAGLLFDEAVVSISDSTIKNNTARYDGGGIFASESSLELTGVTLTGNSAGDGSGGAIAFVDPAGCCGPVSDFELSLNASVVSGNDAARQGGGIYFDADGYSESGFASLTISNSQIADNQAGSGSYGESAGGGAFVSVDGSDFGESRVSISGSQVLRNSAGYGGGMLLDVSDSSDVELLGVTISGNSSYYGGGISFYGESVDLDVIQSTVSGNVGASGGGIYADITEGAVNLDQSTVSDNEAYYYGGGLYVRSSSSSAPVNVSGSTLSGNTAGERGGAILANASAPSDTHLYVTNSTVNGNSAYYGGGGIELIGQGSPNNGTIHLLGSTVVGNPSTEVESSGIGRSQVFVSGFYGSIVDLDHSVVSGNAPDSDVGTTSNDGFGGDAIIASYSFLGSYAYTGEGASYSVSNTTVDSEGSVMLAPLADNGGFTQTMLPMEGSPLINGGSEGTVSGLDVDQRGATRYDDYYSQPMGGNVDIGAVEIQDFNDDGVVDDLPPEFTGDLGRGLRGTVGREVSINPEDFVVDPEGYDFQPEDFEFIGLPDGLTYDDEGSGLIEGTLLTAGEYQVTASATDRTSPTTVVKYTVKVSEPSEEASGGGGGGGSVSPSWLLALLGLVGLRRRR
jgi:hypothetical protein